MEGHYSIKKAAEVLKLSTKTIRNRIVTGELIATWEDRGKGRSQWWIPIECVEAAATTTKEAIPVAREKQLSPVQVVKIIQNAVQETMEKELKSFQMKIEARADQRDELLMKTIRAIQEEKRKSIWQRLFG